MNFKPATTRRKAIKTGLATLASAAVITPEGKAAMPEDINIPDEPGSHGSSITFGTLKLAQALGDRQALLDEDRIVIRFDLGEEVVQSIKQLTEAII